MTVRTLLMTTSLTCFAMPAYAKDKNFNRIASIQVADNLPEAEETSAEIIAAIGKRAGVVMEGVP